MGDFCSCLKKESVNGNTILTDELLKKYTFV